MITKEQIDRINELYKKKTESGLTEEEAKEQAELRRIYINAFKSNLKSQLENIEFVDADNSEKNQGTNKNTTQGVHKHGKDCGCGHNHSHSHSHSHHHGHVHNLTKHKH